MHAFPKRGHVAHQIAHDHARRDDSKRLDSITMFEITFDVRDLLIQFADLFLQNLVVVL